MNGEITVSAGVLAMITLELVKLVTRKYILKKQDFDFPPIFYTTLIPFLTALWGIGLSYVGWGEPVAYTVQTLIQWFVSILIAFASYYLGIQPLKEYSKTYKFNNL